MKKRRIVLPLLLVVMAACLGGGFWDWWTELRFVQSTDDAYVVGDITHVSPKLAGYVVEVAVNNNQAVKAGELLVKLEDRDIRARLDVAAARVRERETAIAVIDRPPQSFRALAAPAAQALARYRLPENQAGRLADQGAPAWVFLTGMKLNLSSTGLRNPDGSWKTKK